MSANSGIKSHWGFRNYTISGDAAHGIAVNTGNGNLVVTVTDSVFPARIPAVFMRTYNSVEAGTSGLLGKGWRLAFEEQVAEQVNNDILYTDTTGAEFTWVYNSGTYDRPTGVFSDIAKSATEITITMPNGFKRVFDVTTGYLIRFEDHNGNQQIFTRDTSNPEQVTKIEGKYGTTTFDLVDTFNYSNGRLTTFGLSTVTGLNWTLGYDANDELLEDVTDPEGNQWSYTYDGTSKCLLTITDPRVNNDPLLTYNTTIAYSGGLVTTITDSESNEIGFAYGGNLCIIQDRRDVITNITHDSGTLAINQVTIDPDPGLNITTQFVWNSNLELESVTDANGVKTVYGYDDNGNLTSVTKAATEESGFVYSFVYDTSYNTLTSFTTPLSKTYSFTYDATTNRNLASRTTPLSETATYEYNSYGDLTKLTDPEGQVAVMTYVDDYGLISTTSKILEQSGESMALTSSFEYSTACLNLIKTTNPSGIVTEMDYDDIGRLTDVRRIESTTSELRTTYEYDCCGNVTKAIQPKNYPTIYTEYSYNSLNLLDAVKQPETTTTWSSQYVYDAEENLTGRTRILDASTSLTTTYVYDNASRVSSVTLPPIGGATPPPDSTYSFTYDSVGNLLTRTDAVGNITTYTYTVLNQVATESGPLEELAFSYSYDDDGNLTAITGQPGDKPTGYTERSYTYAYDDDGRLVSVTNPLSGVTSYTYYGNGKLKTVTLPKQNANSGPASRTYSFDTAGRLAEVKDALGHKLHFEYRSDGRLSRRIDAESRATTYTYDSLGRTTRADYAGGGFAEYEYDDNGNITELTGPDSFKTTYTYDNRNRLATMVRHDETVSPTPVEYTTAYEYDQLGRLLSTVDPRDCKRTYTYDNHSRLVQKNIDINHGSVTDGLDYEYQYSYDLNGRVVQKTDPDQGDVYYTYDALGRVVIRINQADGVTTNEFDLWGNLVSRTYPDFTTDTYSYDVLDRVISQENHLGESYTFEYDDNGNNVTMFAPYGMQSEFGYNDRDELIMTKATDSEDEDGLPVIENFDYTPNGRTSTYGGSHSELWTFQYDEAGRWVNAYTALGDPAQREYNASNTLKSSTGLKGGTFEMTYNGMHLRTSTTATDMATPNTTTYTWDYTDLAQVDEPDGRSTTFTRDRLGRILSTTLTVGQDSYTTDYGYNWRGQVTERDLPDSLCTEAYTYNELGLLTQIDYNNPTNQVQMTYDSRGRQVSVEYSAGHQRQYYYNRLGRMVGDSVMDSAGNFYATYYSFDKAGDRVTQVQDRKYPIGTTLPAYVPQDEFGNPIINTSGPTQQTSIPDYDVFTYTGKSTAHSDITIELQKKTGGTGADQIMFAYQTGNPSTTYGSRVEAFQDPISGTTTLYIIEDEPVLYQTLPAYPPLDPPDFGATTPEVRNQDLNLNAYGQVGDESTQVGTDTAIDDAYDNGKECCGKTAAAGVNGLMADAKRSRGYVKEEVDLNKNLLTQTIGAMNQISGPWDILVPGGAQDPQVPKITIAYAPREFQPVLPWSEYYGEDTSNDSKVYFWVDPKTGLVKDVSQEQASVTEVVAEFVYDCFGRLIEATDRTGASATVQKMFNDWLTGNVQFREGPGEGEQQAESHMSGHTRYTIAEVPEEWRSDWLLRGPHGQVKYAVDQNGVVTDYYGYSSQGNRTQHDIYSGTGILPAYLDGDQQPVESFTQMKSGQGMTQDMTQMIGSLDTPKESGGGGEGASGNPDVSGGGNSTFLQNSGRKGFYAGGQWNDTGFHTLPAYPSERHLPGMGTDKAPASAPQTVTDQATQAD